MESLVTYRKALIKLATDAIAQHAEQPTMHAGQLKTQGNHSEILAFPEDDSGWYPLQVLTEGSDFGKFFYMLNYDGLGDPNHPLR